jgi:hypothetical protein
MSEFNGIVPGGVNSPASAERDQRGCMPPIATSEYKPNITLQETILCVTGVGDEIRKRINEGRKNVEKSRRLIKETKTILEQSTLIILDSQRLTSKVNVK